MRVLLADFMGDPEIERAALPGVEVATLPQLVGALPRPPDLLRVLAERPAPVLLSWHLISFDAPMLAEMARAGVRGIVCTSVGYDHIDLVAAQAAGITICNVPDYGTDEVADHAMALLLWCLRGLRAAPPTAAAPETWWDTARFAPIPRLLDCTLAILGFGRIGQSTARRAQAFGLDVRWCDPYVPRGQEKVTRTTRVDSVHDLLDGADALSLHCLLSDETRGIIDREALALLPPHAVLVNTARGGLIDDDALHEALREGRLAAAAIDVLRQEPPINNALFNAYLRGELPTLLITPHVAWYSQASAVEIRRKAAAEAGRLLRGETPWYKVK